MPRENVHFEVLNSALLVLPPSLDIFTKALTLNPSLSKLGAIAPDAPYFYRSREDFRALGDSLHGGKGENTYNLPARLLKVKPSPELLAFTAGYLSHIAVDQIFHPLVFSLTGNYHDPDPAAAPIARRRHRHFETLLDNYWKTEYAAQYIPVATLLRNCEKCFPPVCSALNEATVMTDWRDAFRQLANFQNKFLSPLWGLLAKSLTVFSPGFAEYEALFNCFRKPGPVFKSEFIYPHPVSGQEQQQTLETLRQQAIKRTIHLFEIFLPLAEGFMSAEEFLLKNKGYSLSFNYPSSDNSSFKYSRILDL